MLCHQEFEIDDFCLKNKNGKLVQKLLASTQEKSPLCFFTNMDSSKSSKQDSLGQLRKINKVPSIINNPRRQNENISLRYAKIEIHFNNNLC